ncbi:hypothetical protein D1B31_07235 [Neobacillus notoginsengisoli]|uniref:Uncharacterized protein n=1 Tax=Neobacillus notoginsengisoli TaxID=1578198 RepID=A0A417YW42_9BACI|nr:hypothetical protein [Neobacillus notoginsengisoli]RHW41508.1 hypothetical protein D1B31_07235 [Neobacillus notoginsengisoli]
MDHIKHKNLKRFEGTIVELAIKDKEGSDQAPAIRKTIKYVLMCPDGTHVRFYFDKNKFLAVPVTSEFGGSEDELTAYDAGSGLSYAVKIIDRG